MARFCAGRAGKTMMRLRLLLTATFFAVVMANVAVAQALYDQPVLVADPGLHTGVIRSADVDNAGQFAVTGSQDKTVRIWSLFDGKGTLLQTIRMPAGPDPVGRIFAVAMSPHGDLMAAGGWTGGSADEESIYIFERSSWGADQSPDFRLKKRIVGLSDVITKLSFSPDGRYLAAALGNPGLRIFDRMNQWEEIKELADPNYEGAIYGMAFASDGRLFTASHDGKVRLYGPDFKMTAAPREMTRGKKPHQIAFRPSENELAVGYADATAVEILSGNTLETISTPNTEGLSGPLPHVAWSRDGNTLFAGTQNVDAWSDAGRGQHRALHGGNDTLMSLNQLPDGGLLIATADPLIRRFDSGGRVLWEHRNDIGNLGNRSGKLAVSSDGAIVDFGFEDGKKARLRFDVRGDSPQLIQNPPDDHLTALPKDKDDGLKIERRGEDLFLQGTRVGRDKDEKVRVWAISSNADRVAVGESFSLRARDANNKPLWRRDGPGSVWAVNIVGNGRLVVAAYDDGTIRWHDMDNRGHELLALMVLPTHSDKMDWVAWTPDGFYGASPGAFGVLQWHVNQGIDAAAKTLRVSDVPLLKQPEFLKLTLQEGGIGPAGRKLAKKARRQAQDMAGSAKPPGARLHVLAIGISKYGNDSINLKFADKDANEVINKLVDTQDIKGPYKGSGGLYADVSATPVINENASAVQIYRKLNDVSRVMKPDDTAVIMFAGHGAMIGGDFYLLPFGVETTLGDAAMAASAMPAREFQKQVAPLTNRGRVLVLLDACHSGAFLEGKRPDADVLRTIMAADNITVVTSSRGTQTAHENDAWQHGAFTKIFLEALFDPDIDEQRGVISTHALTAYLQKKVFDLTHHTQEVMATTSNSAERQGRDDLFARP